jgi:hypothetical protein
MVLKGENKMNYKKIEFMCGETIEDAVNLLLKHKEKGQYVCGEFNGKTLYSDTVTIDSAYIQITGKTKKEFDNRIKKENEEHERRKKEYIAKILKLTKEWIEIGKNILDKKYLKYWEECVPIRLNDLYRGMELGCCLEIVKALNENNSFEFAKELLDKQGHSGMSFGLMCSMISSFCDKGNGFVEFVKNN